MLIFKLSTLLMFLDISFLNTIILFIFPFYDIYYLVLNLFSLFFQVDFSFIVIFLTIFGLFKGSTYGAFA